MLRKIKALLKKNLMGEEKDRRLLLSTYMYTVLVGTGNNKIRSIKRKFYLLTYIIFLFINRKKTIIPVSQIEVTTRCTLACKECGHLIPYYKMNKKDSDYDVKELLDNIDLFLTRIDFCMEFKLLGGETFLYDQLFVLIEKLIASKKIMHVRIITNGTIIPQGKNFDILKNKKVSVSISDYGKLSSKKDELIAVLKQNNIKFICEKFESWMKMSDFERNDYTDDKLKNVIDNCKVLNCRPLYKGKLWLCSRIVAGIVTGHLKENESEFIDLNVCTKEELPLKLEKFYYNYPKFDSCYYCGDNQIEIPCAEQMIVEHNN